MKSIATFCILSLFALFSCQNPCSFTECKNGGNCISGDCNCSAGFSGASCELENVPSQMLIKEVVITNFPARVSRNSTWDNNSGPDIYFVLKKGDETIYTHSSNFQDAGAGERYPFEQVNIQVESPEDRYRLMLYDSDAPDLDELIGEIEFTPYQEGQAFPSLYALDEGGIGAELKVSYEF